MNHLAHKIDHQNHAVSWSFSLPNSDGKEKDYESGFHYYGARYYWSELLTSFISVDRYADKYPSISPYAYCAWNPIRLTDPNGDTVVLKGGTGLIQYAINDMQRRTENLKFNVDISGVVTCSGTPILEEEEYMQEIINNKQINVNVHLQKDSKIRDNIRMLDGGCDAFDGNNVYKDKNGILKATANQYINVQSMRSIDPSNNGDLIWHAVSESFEGAKMALEMGTSVKYNDSNYGYVYNISHNNANYRFCGNIRGFGFDPKRMVYSIDRF